MKADCTRANSRKPSTIQPATRSPRLRAGVVPQGAVHALQGGVEMVGLHAGVDADPVPGVVVLPAHRDLRALERGHHLRPAGAERGVEHVELRVGEHLAAGVEPHGPEQALLGEMGADAVAVPHLLHGPLGGGVDADDVVQLDGREPEVRAHGLERGLGEGAVGVAPRRQAVVELVHRGVEEVGGDLGRAVGGQPQRLVLDPRRGPGGPRSRPRGWRGRGRRRS